MADFPDVKPNDETLRLISSNQSYSSVLTGDKQTAELYGDKWAVNLQFNNRYGDEAATLRAWLFSLGGQRTRFKYSPESISNRGTALGSGVVDGAGQLGSVLATKGWNADQASLFKAGDYLEVNGELKIVPADVAGSDYIEYTGTNYMPSPFDPSVWYGVTVDTDLSYTSIIEPNPSGESFVGEFEYVGLAGTATFTFSSNTSFNIGDKLYTACLLGKNGYSKIRHIVQEYPSAAVVSDFRYDFLTDTVELNTAGVAYKKTDINDDYCIVETEYIAATTGEHRGGIWGDPASGPMPVGAKLKMQAAFFGKADDWPAQLLASANIPIAPALRNSPPDGAQIITDKPSATFRLENDEQAQFQIQGPLIYNASLALLEDF